MMFPFRLRSSTIPLLFRELVLRALLVNALTYLTANIYRLCSYPPSEVKYFPTSYWLLRFMVPPLIVLHHIFRIWLRKHWVVACEALLSFAEAVASGFIITREVIPLYTGGTLDYLFGKISALIMSTSSILASVFLLYDILSSSGKNLLRPYDFSAGLSQPGRQWSFILGQFTTRKRFSTDNLFIRYLRGGLAVLCIVGLSYLIIYTTVWQPMRWNGRPGVKTLELPVLSNGDVIGSSILELIETSQNLVKVVLGPQVTMDSTMNMVVMRVGHHASVMPCQYDFSDVGSITANCLIIPLSRVEVFELLITVRSSQNAYGSPVYLGLTNSTDDILANAEPTFLGPGSNLHGIGSISVKERFVDQGAATLGVPQYRQVVVISVHSLSPDWLSSLPRGNSTATLRITILPQPNVKIEQEYVESSVLSGFALVGGAWTLINGVFAAIFGTTLLLVLFGIKPLSIYGLVHRFQRGKASLIDRDYVLPPEERDYMVGILREHLMDVDDEEAQKSPSDYNPVGTTAPYLSFRS